MPEWIVVILMIFMWIQGFVMGGILYGNTAFWDGVRSGMTFGILKKSK